MRRTGRRTMKASRPKAMVATGPPMRCVPGPKIAVASPGAHPMTIALLTAPSVIADSARPFQINAHTTAKAARAQTA